MLCAVPRTAELPSERAERLVRAYVEDAEPGSQLPAIKAWAPELGTTRATLSRVLKKLEAEGLVVIRQGWGTFVAQAPRVLAPDRPKASTVARSLRKSLVLGSHVFALSLSGPPWDCAPQASGGTLSPSASLRPPNCSRFPGVNNSFSVAISK